MNAKRVIFTADDFGLTVEVNEAVERAHREGVLSAASLMVTAEAAEDAIARAKRLPNLRVGLHVALVDARPALPPAEIPRLVGRDGALHNSPVAASLWWFFTPGARDQLRAEIRAQLEKFRACGLRLDHVNTHQHAHLHPTVLGIILELARDYPIRAVRIPNEPPGGALAPWTWLMRQRLGRAGIATNDRIVGLRHTGHLTTARVMAALDDLAEGTTEFYFHPATARTAALEKAAAGYDRLGELAALTSAEVAARLAALGLKPIGFSDLPA